MNVNGYIMSDKDCDLVQKKSNVWSIRNIPRKNIIQSEWNTITTVAAGTGKMEMSATGRTGERRSKRKCIILNIRGSMVGTKYLDLYIHGLCKEITNVDVASVSSKDRIAGADPIFGIQKCNAIPRSRFMNGRNNGLYPCRRSNVGQGINEIQVHIARSIRNVCDRVGICIAGNIGVRTQCTTTNILQGKITG